jgi:hypothetical protein
LPEDASSSALREHLNGAEPVLLGSTGPASKAVFLRRPGFSLRGLLNEPGTFAPEADGKKPKVSRYAARGA